MSNNTIYYYSRYRRKYYVGNYKSVMHTVIYLLNYILMFNLEKYKYNIYKLKYILYSFGIEVCTVIFVTFKF